MHAIGILGGTFDPIHFGHLRMAQELGEELNLSQVRFIPSGQPPHRPPPHASADRRLDMVRLAVADNPLFLPDPRELDRPGPSFMVDTLTSLRAELGAAVPLCLLLGADAFLGLPSWYRWQELFELAHIVVAHRPGVTMVADILTLPPELREEWQNRHTESLGTATHGTIISREITPLDISASAIRTLVTQGKDPRYLLPDAVLDYIQEHHLYEGIT